MDEVFSAYPLAADATHIRTPDIPGVLTFRLNGLSKLIGLPQAKLGWILVKGPDDDVRAALEALDVIADTYLSVGDTRAGRAARVARGGRVRAASRSSIAYD